MLGNFLKHNKDVFKQYKKHLKNKKKAEESSGSEDESDKQSESESEKEDKKKKKTNGKLVGQKRTKKE